MEFWDFEEQAIAWPTCLPEVLHRLVAPCLTMCVPSFPLKPWSAPLRPLATLLLLRLLHPLLTGRWVPS